MPEDAPRIVMGSKSASRRALLAAMGCADFEVRVPDIDEKAIGDRRGDPRRSSPRSRSPSAALLARHFADHADGGAVLVHGDQVVTFDGSIREKPEDLAEARRFAASYGGASCGTTGCVVVHDVRTNRRHVEVHDARVDFGAFPPGLVDEILAADGDVVMACAGGLMVEHPLLAPRVAAVAASTASWACRRPSSRGSSRASPRTARPTSARTR
ncbi:nucleoside-triphosphate diphosphatase [Aureococcus anophagefferens]|nr:nucleoside-triphosphate diphosphatase [Aureococcus anophagefferens]